MRFQHLVKFPHPDDQLLGKISRRDVTEDGSRGVHQLCVPSAHAELIFCEMEEVPISQGDVLTDSGAVQKGPIRAAQISCLQVGTVHIQLRVLA